MSKLIIIRHGESTWNVENLFCGWVDADLSEKGVGEAKNAGDLMNQSGLLPTVLHTSLLKRAIKTANLALETMDRSWIPVHRTWRLNERHYGGLQGLNKAETREKYGDDQLKAWRRSYDTPPPPIERGSKYDSIDDPRYPSKGVIPFSECLKDVVARMMPYWYDHIIPDLKRGETVLVVAHGNSLRSLVKTLEDISDEDIAELNIPTGVPRAYELDDAFQVISANYLGDPDEIAAKAAAVAAQAQAK